MTSPSLALLPTPLHGSPGLGELLGVGDLLVKRDDLTGFAWGGNKVRTVEHLLANSIVDGDRRWVVCGGAASNFAALAAVAGAVHGIEVHQVAFGEPPTDPPPALRVGRAAGSIVHFTGSDDRESMEPMAAEIVARLDGARLVPRGGADAAGAAGFAHAAVELVDQLRERAAEPATLLLPVGSGGTIAGLVAGLDPERVPRVVGVSVSRPADELRTRVLELAHEIRGRTGRTGPSPEVEILDGRGGGFGVTGPDALDVADLILRRSGLVVDLTYNLKALSHLRTVSFGPGPHVYWLTGGLLDSPERAPRVEREENPTE